MMLLTKIYNHRERTFFHIFFIRGPQFGFRKYSSIGNYLSRGDEKDEPNIKQIGQLIRKFIL